jgi:hypothetical protein
MKSGVLRSRNTLNNYEIHCMVIGIAFEALGTRNGGKYAIRLARCCTVEIEAHLRGRLSAALFLSRGRFPKRAPSGSSRKRGTLLRLAHAECNPLLLDHRQGLPASSVEIALYSMAAGNLLRQRGRRPERRQILRFDVARAGPHEALSGVGRRPPPGTEVPALAPRCARPRLIPRWRLETFASLSSSN